MRPSPLTTRQRATLEYLCTSQPVRTGDDGSVLAALEAKGYVTRHHFSQGQSTYYTWTLTDEGRLVAEDIARQDREQQNWARGLVAVNKKRNKYRED